MSDWRQRLTGLAADLEDGLDGAIGKIGRRFGRRGPPRAVLYRGFGTRERVRILGRVLEDSDRRPSDAKDPRWRNALNALSRFETGEVPGAHVRLRYGATSVEVVADDEGYFNVWIDGPAPDAVQAGWHPVEADLIKPPGGSSSGHVLVPPPGARFGIISDLDDTVIRTGVRRLAELVTTTFLENARTRLPFPGVAAFYHALHAGAAGDAENPVFYVSSSPWNLHGFLLEFLEVRGIPIGPVLLRDWGASRTSLLPVGHHAHKSRAIELIFQTYPTLPFVLIGDSGQHDPEIYRDMAEQHPGRVMAIYIRDVTANPIRSAQVQRLAAEVVALGSRMVLVADTLDAARHAAEHGWIASERVETVRQDVAL